MTATECTATTTGEMGTVGDPKLDLARVVRDWLLGFGPLVLELMARAGQLAATTSYAVTAQ